MKTICRNFDCEIVPDSPKAILSRLYRDLLKLISAINVQIEHGRKASQMVERLQPKSD
jgi:hypothetical protein